MTGYLPCNGAGFIDKSRQSQKEHLINLTHLPLDKMSAILADEIFKHIFLNENIGISIQISLKFVPKDLMTIL